MKRALFEFAALLTLLVLFLAFAPRSKPPIVQQHHSSWMAVAQCKGCHFEGRKR